MIFFRKARKPSKRRAEELKEELDTSARAESVDETGAEFFVELAEDQVEKAPDSVSANSTKAKGEKAKRATKKTGDQLDDTINATGESPKKGAPEILAEETYTKQQFDVANAILAASSSIELARRIAVQTAGSEGGVGDYLENALLEDGIIAHFFESSLEGYNGWKWAVVLTLLPDETRILVSESVLLPGEGALLAPDWVPFKDRLKPADMTELDEIEYAPDDERLETFELLKKEDLKTLENLALERNRVLNAYGKEDLAVRWYEGTHGPFTASTRIAGATCMSCAFYIPLAGDLGQLFGACANAWSRDDGRVVSADHGCGMHSETDVSKKAKRWNPVESAIDQFDSVDIDTPADASTKDEDDTVTSMPEDGSEPATHSVHAIPNGETKTNTLEDGLDSTDAETT